MKVARFPQAAGSGDVLVVMHNLALAEGRLRELRPVHVLTHVAQHHKGVATPLEAFGLSVTLENKLFAVAHYAALLCEAISPLSVRLYDDHYVTSYDPIQKIIAVLEGYIGAIYSALEVTALLNKCFDRTLRQGFRQQAKKYQPFSFSQHQWLKHFYDVRSELAHYNSPLLLVSAQKLIIDFRNPSKLEMFQRGRHEIPFELIVGYATELFSMLDAWALVALKDVDRSGKVALVKEPCWKQPLESKEITIEELFLELGI